MHPAFSENTAKLSGRITSPGKEGVKFATVYLKETTYGCTTDSNGKFEISAPAGSYVMVVSILGYETAEKNVEVRPGKVTLLDIEIAPKATDIEGVVVRAAGVSRIKESAYNAIAIDAKVMHNSTADLANALSKVPGVKVRESGGVGSDARFSLDGFSGKHIKFFIDGVPMDGMGTSFGINNIPINLAERIEVYRGVVPVGFGADAIGGVVNIVTGGAARRRTFLDVSYSYGSFNTHRSYINFGHTSKKGFTFEINAYQNYSDNTYKIQTPVKYFEQGGMDETKEETVKRFHDTYHNESIIIKTGVVNKKIADKFIIGINLSQSEKEIQTGIRQLIVFGDKRTKAHSVMPSLHYRKRNFIAKGLDVSITANMNYNITRNIDTSRFEYNWHGDVQESNSLGEHTYQDSKFNNNNWNATVNASYRIGNAHSIVVNHMVSGFDRRSVSAAGTTDNSEMNTAATAKKTSRKNITGLSYRISKEGKWNVSVFGKNYNQSSTGPIATTTTSTSYTMHSESVNSLGYGIAGTLFLWDLQAKLSYERASRLPSADELFGDQDLELGAADLKPESSHNYNVGLSYSKAFGRHLLYIEPGFIYRDTKNYIKRSTEDQTGGRESGISVNHGKVKTIGASVEARYNYSDWLSVGVNATLQDVRDNEKFLKENSLQESTTYNTRIPNIPYLFSNADINFYINDIFNKGHTLTISYDNLYVHNFPLYTVAHGLQDTKYIVPLQFSHNISLIYSIKGRYNFSVECRNFTNEKLYDNFKLQKAGRAFYIKLRYFFGK